MNAQTTTYTATLPDCTVIRRTVAAGVTKSHVVIVRRVENDGTSRWRWQSWNASEEGALGFMKQAKQGRAAYEARPNLGDNSKYVDWQIIPACVEAPKQDALAAWVAGLSKQSRSQIARWYR